MRLDLPKTTAELAYLDAVCARHSRNVLGDDPDKQHRPVQHLVVLDLRLRSRVTGTRSVCVVRKTVVPETRASGIFSQVARKEASGIATGAVPSRVVSNPLVAP